MARGFARGFAAAAIPTSTKAKHGKPAFTALAVVPKLEFDRNLRNYSFSELNDKAAQVAEFFQVPYNDWVNIESVIPESCRLPDEAVNDALYFMRRAQKMFGHVVSNDMREAQRRVYIDRIIEALGMPIQGPSVSWNLELSYGRKTDVGRGQVDYMLLVLDAYLFMVLAAKGPSTLEQFYPQGFASIYAMHTENLARFGVSPEVLRGYISNGSSWKLLEYCTTTHKVRAGATRSLLDSSGEFNEELVRGVLEPFYFCMADAIRHACSAEVTRLQLACAHPRSKAGKSLKVSQDPAEGLMVAEARLERATAALAAAKSARNSDDAVAAASLLAKI